MKIRRIKFVIFVWCFIVISFYFTFNCLAASCDEIYANDGQCVIESNCSQDKALDTASGICPSGLVCCHKFTAPINLKLQVPIFGYTNVKGLAEYIGKIYQYALYVIIPLAILVIMFAGLRWIFAAGDPAKIKNAKKYIIDALIGLVIALLGSVILSFLGLSQIKESQVSAIPARGDTIILNGQEYTVDQAMSILPAERRGTVSTFNSASCNKNENTFQVFFTNYNSPEYGNRGAYISFWCNIAMQCKCPQGYPQDYSQSCQLSGFSGGYHPCAQFPQGTPYCTQTASLATPKANYTVAADQNCFNLKSGCQFKIQGDPSGNTYQIQDTGSAILGHHMDLYVGYGTQNLNKIAGVYTITLLNPGACYK